MTDTIKDIVSKLRTKVVALHEQLQNERSNNNVISEELEAVYEVLKEKQKKMLDLEEKVQTLQTEVLQFKDQLSKQVTSVSKEAEIDSLVREIESCISYLKQ